MPTPTLPHIRRVDALAHGVLEGPGTFPGAPVPAIRFIFRSSVQNGREVVVDEPVVRIGRDPATCQVLFDEGADRVVSRIHAEVRRENGRVMLAPTPGKVVLRRREQLTGPVEVLVGDVFELAGPGGPAFEVRWEQDASEKPTIRDPRQPAPAPAAPSAVAVAPPAVAPVPPAAKPVLAPLPLASPAVVAAPVTKPVVAPLPAAPIPVAAPLPVAAPIPVAAPAPLPEAFAEAPTERQVAPIVLPQPVVLAPKPATIPAPLVPTPPPPSVPPPAAVPPTVPPPALRQPAPAPSEPPRTMMLKAFDPNDAGGASGSPSTQFLRLDQLEEEAPPEDPKSNWKKAVAIVVVIVLLVGGIGAFVLWRGKAERARLAAERVARLREAIAAGQQALPAVSEEDWAEFEKHEAAKAGGDEAAAEAARRERERLQAELEKQKEGEVEKQKQVAAQAEAKRAAAETLAKLKPEARATFADLRRLELERIALGRPKDRKNQLRLEAVEEELTAKRAAYDALATQIAAADKPSASERIYQRALRTLGECEIAPPNKLLDRVAAAVAKLKNDKEKRAAFEGALAKSRELGYARNITAALGDEKLPVELFFLPYFTSAFDEQKIGARTELGIPKGMWQLVPSVAKAYRLEVGAGEDSDWPDPDDERHVYEKETRAAAKALRDLWRGPAAGSAALVFATWSNGDPGALYAAKKRMKLQPADADPAAVSLAALWEGGVLTGPQQDAVVEAIAAISVGAAPQTFGFSFPVPVKPEAE